MQTQAYRRKPTLFLSRCYFLKRLSAGHHARIEDRRRLLRHTLARPLGCGAADRLHLIPHQEYSSLGSPLCTLLEWLVSAFRRA